VLVATPGRLLDHIEAKNAVLNQVEYVVLDEADRMLDIGFLPDLQRILSYLPKQRTTLLFSATFSPEIKRLANSYLQDPVTIEVSRPNATASTVEQHFYSVPDDDKRRAVKQIVRQRGITQAFVFVNSKLGCARLARSLEREGMKTTALHGDKSQDERLKALDAFKKGEVDLLVATDVAARGLDIKDVPAVFNFDVPFNAEDYIHRIGRTGRAGASGLAVTLVSPSDTRLMADLEKLLKRKIEIEPLEFDEDRRAAASTTAAAPGASEEEERDERCAQRERAPRRRASRVRARPRGPVLRPALRAARAEARRPGKRRQAGHAPHLGQHQAQAQGGGAVQGDGLQRRRPAPGRLFPGPPGLRLRHPPAPAPARTVSWISSCGPRRWGPASAARSGSRPTRSPCPARCRSAAAGSPASTSGRTRSARAGGLAARHVEPGQQPGGAWCRPPEARRSITPSACRSAAASAH
jgi:superfamily II DNA/RNA helicase